MTCVRCGAPDPVDVPNLTYERSLCRSCVDAEQEARLTEIRDRGLGAWEPLAGLDAYLRWCEEEEAALVAQTHYWGRVR